MLIGVVGNINKQDVPAAVGSLAGILVRRGHRFLLHVALREALGPLDPLAEFVEPEELRRRSDVVIAFGGDGTMLSTSRFLAGSGVPLVGVNLGKLGFLAEFSVDSLEQMLDELLAGTTRTVERTLVTATFPGNPDQEPLVALNDIVIDKRGSTLMLQLETYVNGDFLGAYNADGLIVATPTGSTAYALAVGGPVVTPSSKVFVIAPIAPHMLTARPVVVPDTATIEVIPTSHYPGNDSVHVYADGQVHRNVPMPTRVVITRYEHCAYLVKRTTTTYFDVLRAKLLWGREPVLNIRPATPDGKF